MMGFSLCAVSLWKLNAISLDRLLALLLGLRYKQVITLNIISFWIMSTVSASAISFFWNSPIWLWFGTHSCFTGFSNRDLLLYQDFVYPPSSPKSNTRAYSTTEPNKSTEHREIQEGNVHCTVVAVRANRLLSTICNSGSFDHSNREGGVRGLRKPQNRT